jgi:O-antigen ligase
MQIEEANQYHKFLRRWLYMIIFFLMLTPSIYLFPGIPSVRLEMVSLLIFIGVLVLRLAKNKKAIVAWGLCQKLFLGLFFVITLSILLGTMLGFDSSVADFNQFIRLIKYLMIYTLALTVMKTSNDPNTERDRILHYIITLSLLLCLITIQQYFNLFHLNNWYVQAIAPTQYETLVGGYEYPRPVGMIGNPNELGFLFVLTACSTTYLLIKNKINMFYLLILGLQIIGLFLTMSRSSFVALIAGLFFLVLGLVFSKLSIDFRRTKRFLLLLSCATIVVFFVASQTQFYEQIFWRFETLLNLKNNTSWHARLDHWSENIRLFKQSPFLGVGPLRRADFQYAADNEWLLLLRSYGIFGTIYIISVFLLPQLLSRKREFRVLVIAVFVSAAVYMIPLAVFYSLTLMPMVLIILALGDTTSKLINVKR